VINEKPRINNNSMTQACRNCFSLAGDANSGPFSDIFGQWSVGCFHNLCELDLFLRISARFDSITIGGTLPGHSPHKNPINFNLINGRPHDM